MSELTVFYGSGCEKYPPDNRDRFSDALDIRRQIFIDEQGLSESKVIDGLDSYADHYVGYTNYEPIMDEDGHYVTSPDANPVATARVRQISTHTDKVGTHDIMVERVGVLKDYRGQGVGKAIMSFVLTTQQGRGTLRNILLESPVSVKEFYLKLGFIPIRNVVKYAGVDHIKMYKPITTEPLFLGQKFPKEPWPTKL